MLSATFYVILMFWLICGTCGMALSWLMTLGKPDKASDTVTKAAFGIGAAVAMVWLVSYGGKWWQQLVRESNREPVGSDHCITTYDRSGSSQDCE